MGCSNGKTVEKSKGSKIPINEEAEFSANALEQNFIQNIKNALENNQDPDSLVFQSLLTEIKFIKDESKRIKFLKSLEMGLASARNNTTANNSQMQAAVKFQENQQMIQEFSDINFRFFQYNQQQLIEATVQIFWDIGFYQIELGCMPDQMNQFASEVAVRYQDNPFHNFKHGFSVFQFTYSLRKQIQQLTTLIVGNALYGHLLACLAHDIDHPGVNNAFLISQKHELSIRYNDNSVLENHHSSILFHILSVPRLNVLRKFQDGDQRKLRKQMIQSILATDMSKHFEVVNNFDKCAGDFVEEKKCQALLDFLIHAADVHNPSLSWDISYKWSLLIVEEFTSQTVKEQQLGMPVTIFMQIDMFILPTFTELCKYFPEMQFLVENISQNKARWKEVKSLQELG